MFETSLEVKKHKIIYDIHHKRALNEMVNREYAWLFIVSNDTMTDYITAKITCQNILK